ncbi:hypothetical protein GBAR_LOCUS8302 [Geodia barretti]|uniref:Uncharacterized protein n=1 Tax=Geodia barretti TaxID=519541 RepID=A0AA35RK67_GEOBA|nr:hypothetical protein GBAR_LOCUS8302 [Geodia barretti]
MPHTRGQGTTTRWCSRYDSGLWTLHADNRPSHERPGATSLSHREPHLPTESSSMKSTSCYSALFP